VGRFLNGDSGAAAELSRLFGNTELAFYLRSTDFASFAGARLGIPLTLGRELAPWRVRPRLPDLYTQEQGTVVFARANVLRRDVGRSLATDHEIGRVYRTRDRLQAVTIRAHVSTLREAVRRWLKTSSLYFQPNPGK
jgi:hypothetical protein